MEALVSQLAELPLEFSPGTAWNYSVSTDVLGYLVQLLSDQPGLSVGAFSETPYAGSGFGLGFSVKTGLPNPRSTDRLGSTVGVAWRAPTFLSIRSRSW